MPFAFFNRKRKPTAVSKKPILSKKYIALRKEYVRLCIFKTSFPARKAYQDFNTLVSHPRIQAITIDLENQCIFIGTKLVVLKHEGVSYRIGEFIVTISRANNWFRFENIDGIIKRTDETPPIQTFVDEEVDVFHHPHIPAGGKICMTVGEEHIKQAIVQGDMLTACTMTVDALFRLDIAPYRAVTYWPIYEGGDDEEH